MVDNRSLPDPESRKDGRYDNEVDYSDPSVSGGRRFYLNFGFMRYGTSDAIQGAALLLTFVLLILVVISVVAAFWLPSESIKDIREWLTPPIMLTLGVAIGRSNNGGTSDFSNEVS